jgi:hypothetical protein
MDATEMTFTTDALPLGQKVLTAAPLTCVRTPHVGWAIPSTWLPTGVVLSGDSLAVARDRRGRHVCRDDSLAATGDVVFSRRNQVVTVKEVTASPSLDVESRGARRLDQANKHEYSDSGGTTVEIAISDYENVTAGPLNGVSINTVPDALASCSVGEYLQRYVTTPVPHSSQTVCLMPTR